jgi:uncharacterized integral membrane protein (TIGR00697 family)
MTSASAPAPAPVRFASRGSSYYDVLLAGFCVVIIVSNIAATKPIEVGGGSLTLGPVQFWPLIFDGGAVVFPLAYILGDVMSEVYGFAAARRAVFAAFAAAIVSSFVFLIVMHAPAPDWYENQAAFEAVAGPVAHIVLASLIGFTAGNLINSWVLVSMKKRTAERQLVARLLGSTGAGELADTFLFCAIAASAIGIDSWGAFLNYFVVGVLFKVSVEVAVLPITVRVIAALKAAEPTY